MELVSQIFNKYLHDKCLLFMKLNIQDIQHQFKSTLGFSALRLKASIISDLQNRK